MAKIIVVDDGDLAEVIRAAGDDGCELVSISPVDRSDPEKRASPYQIASHTARSVAGPADAGSIVIINADLACEGFARYEQGGVEVFKFLRLTEEFGGEPNRARDAHCILCSFRSLPELVRQKPSSCILCSEGATFRRLPLDFRPLPPLASLVSRKARPDTLKAFVRGGLTLPDERHTWANWYSAWQMLQVYELATDDEEVSADAFLLPTSDGEVRDALFVYGRANALEKAVAPRRKKLERKREQIRRATQIARVGLIDDQTRQIEGRTRYGWQSVLSRLLFGRGDAVVDVLEEMKAGITRVDVGDPADWGLQGFDFSDYACLLLDLRLREEERGPVVRLDELSGAKLLGQIRTKCPMLPIIITTASNKVRTFEKLMELGADAYWIKQGVDEHRTGEDLVEDYARLLEIVSTATGDRYQFAHRLGRELLGHRTPGDPNWWDATPWFKGHSPQQRIERNAAIEAMIRDVLFMLRQHLHRYEMGYGFKGHPDAIRFGYEDAEGERLSMISVLQHGGKIVEAIHGCELVHDEGCRSTIGGTWDPRSRRWTVGPKQRGDWLGYYLLGTRNRASHFGDHDTIDWEAFETFLIHLACYLRYGPQAAFRPPHFSMAKESGDGREGIDDSVARFLVEEESDYTKRARRLRG